MIKLPLPLDSLKAFRDSVAPLVSLDFTGLAVDKLTSCPPVLSLVSFGLGPIKVTAWLWFSCSRLTLTGGRTRL